MSIIKHVTLQKIVAHDFPYDTRNSVNVKCSINFQFYNWKNYFQDKKGKILPKFPDNKYAMAVVFIMDLLTYFNELSMKFQGKSKRLCGSFPVFKACELKLSLLDKYNQ